VSEEETKAYFLWLLENPYSFSPLYPLPAPVAINSSRSIGVRVGWVTLDTAFNQTPQSVPIGGMSSFGETPTPFSTVHRLEL
jgi:hypothetical protein